jgi:hypothetical protein
MAVRLTADNPGEQHMRELKFQGMPGSHSTSELLGRIYSNFGLTLYISIRPVILTCFPMSDSMENFEIGEAQLGG